MSMMLRIRLAGTFLLLLWLCSCTTKDSTHVRLPAQVRMNEKASRGGWLILTVGLKNGKKLPFLVDTGAAVTVFDKSLEGMLGKKLSTGTITNFGVEHETGAYTAPKLYMGNARLQMTGDFVGTYDCRNTTNATRDAFMGILGMDVLEHYCIQLDFAEGLVRFLDDEHLNKQDLGEAFPLVDLGDSCCFIRENLAGVKGPDSQDNRGFYSMIDTGHDFDGWLGPELFDQWTNQTQLPKDGEAHSPNGALGGRTYAELKLDRRGEKQIDPHTVYNGIGIHFLSRHLVTLDFPRKVMYLKETSKWALVEKDREQEVNSEALSAAKFAKRLKNSGRLPGWTKQDEGRSEFDFHINGGGPVTLDLKKKGNADSFHYSMIRETKSGQWELQKAWRTDESGKTIEDYPVP